MEGKSSVLCLAGPENAVSASILSPIAIATEPVRLEVSMAKINGSRAILLAFIVMFLRFLPEQSIMAIKNLKKKFFLYDDFQGLFLCLPLCYTVKNDIIGHTNRNRIFRLQNGIRFYTLKSAKIQPTFLHWRLLILYNL